SALLRHELSRSPHRKKGLPSTDPTHWHSRVMAHPGQVESVLAAKQPPWTTAWPAVQHWPLMHKGLPSLHGAPWGAVGLEHAPAAVPPVPPTCRCGGGGGQTSGCLCRAPEWRVWRRGQLGGEQTPCPWALQP